MFSATIESRDETNVISVPERELSIGDLDAGDAYRIAILPQSDGSGSDDASASATPEPATGGDDPPVSEGDTLEVEIEDVGDQGDGIARIGPGYIVFVSGTDVGDRVTIEIEQARANYAFGEVLEPEPVSE